VCAPAGPVDAAVLEEGITWLEGLGFRVCRGACVLSRSGYLAGSDAERLSDLLSLVRDPGVDAIVLARGGYGVSRILRELDAGELRESRKLFVGYSDATALLLFLRERAGLATIHGPMLDRVDTTCAARERLLALLRGAKEGLAPLRGRALQGGRARGPLVGGNLSLVAASLGTPWEPDTRGALLFLEEIGEEPYRIDRMLVQLREAGKLGAAAGVAFGALVGCEGARYPRPSALEVVGDVVLPEVRGPVLVDLPFGHVADHHALGVGVEAALDGEAGTLALLGPVAEEVR
jgi:muramoyltetrapeptide carboxypeptidase